MKLKQSILNGIIAGIIDEIGIVEIINEQLGVRAQEKLTSGIIVKSIILNALGFVSRPLYLFPQFFQDKATEHLFGEGILPEDFNDDKVGRVMDKLYQFGLTKIFLLIALTALKKYGVEHKYSHLDSTSISLQGDYALSQTVTPENLELIPIQIVRGHSKDKRPDLKQFLINLIASGDGGVPLFLACGNGNDNDKAKFARVLSNFKKFEKKTEKIAEQKKKAGRFILATNVLENLTPSEILTAYKGQQSCERGFKFLKDPLFFADSVFLKYPSRVETLAMLMGLSLLVYTRLSKTT